MAELVDALDSKYVELFLNFSLISKNSLNEYNKDAQTTSLNYICGLSSFVNKSDYYNNIKCKPL